MNNKAYLLTIHMNRIKFLSLNNSIQDFQKFWESVLWPDSTTTRWSGCQFCPTLHQTQNGFCSPCFISVLSGLLWAIYWYCQYQYWFSSRSNINIIFFNINSIFEKLQYQYEKSDWFVSLVCSIIANPSRVPCKWLRIDLEVLIWVKIDILFFGLFLLIFMKYGKNWGHVQNRKSYLVG